MDSSRHPIFGVRDMLKLHRVVEGWIVLGVRDIGYSKNNDLWVGSFCVALTTGLTHTTKLDFKRKELFSENVPWIALIVYFKGL